MLHRIIVLVSFIATVSAITIGAVGSTAAAPLVRLHDDMASTDGGLILKVHSRHCSTRYGHVRHWHGRRGHVHRRWHRHGRCYSYRRRYYRPYRAYYRRPYYRRYYARPRFYGYRRHYRRRYRRGVSIRLRF